MAQKLPGYRSQELYVKVLNWIRRTYRPGDRLATQVELARRYGVCVQTMQRVLAALASQGWLVRSRRSGTFVAPGPAQGGRSVLWVLSAPRQTTLIDRYHRDLFAGAAYRIVDAGCSLRLLNGWSDNRLRPGETAGSSWAAILDTLDLSAIDALVAVQPDEPEPFAALAERMPVIAIEPRRVPASCSTVSPDYNAAIAATMDRLYTMGHTRVGFWGLNEPRIGPRLRSCYQAFLEWTARARLVPARQWLSILEPGEPLARPVGQFVASAQTARPTAIFVCGQARLVVGELQARGLRIGHDLCIVAIGDRLDQDAEPVHSSDTPPLSLASMEPDIDAVSELIAGELSIRLSDAIARPRTLLAPVHFRPGQSCPLTAASAST